MAPLVRTGGSRHTGLAALPHRNIQWEKEDFNIHIEEDMFDNLLWYANSDYFFTTHPLISMEDIIQVEKRIGAMQRQGGTVAYRRRIGNEEDYIEPSACSE